MYANVKYVLCQNSINKRKVKLNKGDILLKYGYRLKYSWKVYI